MRQTPKQRQNYQHKVDTMVAYFNGASIEQRPRTSNLDLAWVSNATPLWDWIHFDYRVCASITPESDVDCFGEPITG